MAEFKGLKKDEHEKLTRAVTMYTNLTGEKIDVGAIPVYSEEEDAKAKAKRDEEQLKAKAAVTRKLEEAQQEERRIRQRMHNADGVQDGNMGPGQPAGITQKAKAQGKSRKGSEPETVTGEEGSQNRAEGSGGGDALS